MYSVNTQWRNNARHSRGHEAGPAGQPSQVELKSLRKVPPVATYRVASEQPQKYLFVRQARARAHDMLRDTELKLRTEFTETVKMHTRSVISRIYYHGELQGELLDFPLTEGHQN